MPAPRPTGIRDGDMGPPRVCARPGRDAVWGEPDWLEVSVSAQPDHAIVALVGELDIAGTGALSFQMSALVAQGCTRIVVDVSDLVFCGASGLGTLIEAAQRAARCGGWVRLAGARAPLVRIIGIAKLTRILPGYRTVDDALEDSSPPRADDGGMRPGRS
jgi:anti-anti-sigma factor